MRITAQAKEETRRRILDAARRMFADRGFEGTSTRELAGAAGIAAGTLFNYFPNKEALAMTMVAEALSRGTTRYGDRRRGEESFEEDLFAHVAAGLRELEPFRHYLGEVLETALSPFGRSEVTRMGDDVRAAHLSTVAGILASHGLASADGFVSIHLYWTLYLGVLAFWSKDDSPGQEDTLVVLDRSVHLFATSVADGAGQGEDSDEPGSR